ncbi:alginate biosynthesis protein AlgX [Azotobacter vinelandii CA]|uniref:Alginate biosynthesis protein AlgX n=2 Tax=Azotobacter vinelandii TaxID=354 RepID=C1DP90_AZOVD|nr:alginate biosynthesis protein AlgX [Azotobacter vinelandii]ACO77322.1 alginate biosynthesis protein AlgX [Azotobacter vinelandii DJ]AGK13246.1 alginate biosynthesis protein AlgX [Azotobacter vinelandii CA]AGK17535.1 alginate biosynthesis protein AlgX [Azotobacter vinelandii CA6]SFY01737.1 alginate biosynthesis protein AlgX [Azotobacter vinelandii]
MKTHNSKWIGPAALAAAIALAAAEVRAEETPTGLPVYRAESCCDLCPAAADPNSYTSNYMKGFVTLVQGNESDWLFRTNEDLRTEFGTTPEGYRQLKALHDAFKSRGVELVIVYQPTRGMVQRNKLLPADYARFDYDKAVRNFRATLKHFEQLGYWVPDLTPLTDEKVEPAFYFRGDHHWTSYGAERSARIVAETVKEIPAFADIPRKEFVTKKMGRMGKRGTHHRVAGQLCNTTYAFEHSDQFFTEPKGEGGGDLFGDSSLPQITLVGTSHSGTNYNFAGFLSEYMGAEILNVAFPGSGLEGSMLEYLASDEFQKNPPKILIWEFSPLYDLAEDKFYRQALSMLGNACEGEKTLLAGKATLRPGEAGKEVLINGAGRLVEATNSRHQVDIRFSDPSVKKLEGTIWYMTGRREKFQFDKPVTTETNGRFAFNMRDEADWGGLNFFAMEIQPPEGLKEPVEVEVRLCKRHDYHAPANLTARSGN